MAKTTKVPYWIAICSALLNVFLFGIVFAHFVLPHGSSFLRHERGPFAHMEEALQTLDSPYREKIQAIIDRNKDNMHGEMDKMTGAFSQIDAILTAPVFDPAKLKSANARIEQNGQALKNDMMDMMASIAAALPDQERIRFFRQMSPHSRGGHGS